MSSEEFYAEHVLYYSLLSVIMTFGRTEHSLPYPAEALLWIPSLCMCSSFILASVFTSLATLFAEHLMLCMCYSITTLANHHHNPLLIKCQFPFSGEMHQLVMMA